MNGEKRPGAQRRARTYGLSIFGFENVSFLI